MANDFSNISNQEGLLKDYYDDDSSKSDAERRAKKALLKRKLKMVAQDLIPESNLEGDLNQ